MADTTQALLRINAWFPELADLPRGVFLVGGAVRDALLGREPMDADLTTANPEPIAAAFAAKHRTNLIELGRDPLLVLRAIVRGRVYDFAPMTGDSIECDLLRRDFTMNAMAMEISPRRLVDPTRGQSDIDKKLVRMVSEQNFRDDPLRIVKAVRMAVNYGFEIEPATMDSMRRNVALIANTAVERVTYELMLILSSAEPARGVELLRRAAIDEVIFGRALTEDDAARIAAADSRRPEVAFGLLLADRSDDELDSFGRRWRLSGDVMRSILTMRRVARTTRENPEGIRVALFDSGLKQAEPAVEFLRGAGEAESAGLLRRVLDTDGERISSLKPLLDGEEIAELTALAPGRELGELKRRMIEAQVRGEIRTREEAIAFVGATRKARVDQRGEE